VSDLAYVACESVNQLNCGWVYLGLDQEGIRLRVHFHAGEVLYCSVCPVVLSFRLRDVVAHPQEERFQIVEQIAQRRVGLRKQQALKHSRYVEPRSLSYFLVMCSTACS